MRNVFLAMLCCIATLSAQSSANGSFALPPPASGSSPVNCSNGQSTSNGGYSCSNVGFDGNGGRVTSSSYAVYDDRNGNQRRDDDEPAIASASNNNPATAASLPGFTTPGGGALRIDWQMTVDPTLPPIPPPPPKPTLIDQIFDWLIWLFFG